MGLPYELMIVIIDRGRASKVLEDFKKHGVKGGTIFYGHGTAKEEILKFLGIEEIEKEILLTVVEKDIVEELYETLTHIHGMENPNHGIAFNLPLNRIIGTEKIDYGDKKDGSHDSMKYEAVFIVVDKHRGEDVIEVSEKYGGKGGTIIHGRGSGIHEKASIFNIVIEPEKEIVLILTPENKSDDIIRGIGRELKIEEPGNGIIFSTQVTKTLGLID